MEKKEQKRAKLHRMQEHELSDVRKLIEKENKLKKGGSPKLSEKISGSFMKRGAPHGEVAGGSLTNLHIPKKGRDTKPLNSKPEKGSEMKKKGMFNEGGHCTKVKVYKHGGHHKMHRAGGGTVYEHEMVGEHPTHSFHHYDYEGMMRGEKPTRHREGYAAGGVAKIRHGAATKEGHPINHKNPRVKVY